MAVDLMILANFVCHLITLALNKQKPFLPRNYNYKNVVDFKCQYHVDCLERL